MEKLTIPVRRDYYEEKCYLYKADTVEFLPGLTVLVGCNGSGKSTLINIIEDFAKKNKIKYISYNNLTNGGANAISRMGFLQDFAGMANNLLSSEGEQILNNIARFLPNIHQANRFIRRNEEYDQNTLIITFDAVDSGFSIDNMIELKSFIKDVLIEDQKKRENIDVFFILSTNSYEFANGEKCIDAMNLSPIEFKSYNGYRRFIIKTSKEKDKRNKKWDKQIKINEKKEKKNGIQWEPHKLKPVKKSDTKSVNDTSTNMDNIDNNMELLSIKRFENTVNSIFYCDPDEDMPTYEDTILDGNEVYDW